MPNTVPSSGLFYLSRRLKTAYNLLSVENQTAILNKFNRLALYSYDNLFAMYDDIRLRDLVAHFLHTPESAEVILRE